MIGATLGTVWASICFWAVIYLPAMALGADGAMAVLGSPIMLLLSGLWFGGATVFALTGGHVLDEHTKGAGWIAYALGCYCALSMLFFACLSLQIPGAFPGAPRDPTQATFIWSWITFLLNSFAATMLLDAVEIFKINLGQIEIGDNRAAQITAFVFRLTVTIVFVRQIVDEFTRSPSSLAQADPIERPLQSRRP